MRSSTPQQSRDPERAPGRLPLGTDPPVLRPPAGSSHVLLARLLALLICLGSLLLIIHTYSVFDQTWDEPATLGAGVEWYTHHTYNLDNIDPPLPRIFTAALPYLVFHARSHEIDDPWQEGNAILASGNYHHILTSARIGTLPFFLLAVSLVWVRARDWLGEWPAAIAVLLLSTCEPVLAHSALATTDASFMATFFLAMDRAWRLQSAPSLRNALLFGVAAALAIVSKLSALPYLILAFALLLPSTWLLRRRTPAQPARPAASIRSWKLALTSGLVCALLVWSAYFFSIGTVLPLGGPDRVKTVNLLESHSIPTAPVLAALDHLPAPSYFRGLRNARAKRLHLSPSYFLGKVNTTGHILFFPVALLVKTPIPFLLLGLAGACFAIVRLRTRRDPYVLLLLVCLLTPLLFGALGHVNQGLRHVLAVYPPLAILGALGARELWRIHRARVVVVLLLIWQTTACLYAAPDFLPYFNEPASPYAEFLLADSDLDWGQDLKRLGPVLQHLHADRIAIAYNGTEDLHRAGLPPWQPLPPSEPVSGWVVISDLNLKFFPDRYGWLEQYKPVAKAGRSILIYHIPGTPSPPHR